MIINSTQKILVFFFPNVHPSYCSWFLQVFRAIVCQIFFYNQCNNGCNHFLSVQLLKPLCQETLLVFSYRTQCVDVHIPRNFLFLSFSSWNCGSSEPFIIENNTEHSFSVHLFLKHCTEFFFVGSKDTICKYAYIRKF